MNPRRPSHPSLVSLPVIVRDHETKIRQLEREGESRLADAAAVSAVAEGAKSLNKRVTSQEEKHEELLGRFGALEKKLDRLSLLTLAPVLFGGNMAIGTGTAATFSTTIGFVVLAIFAPDLLAKIASHRAGIDRPSSWKEPKQ